MTKPLRIGIIGLNRGADHARAFHKLEGSTVTAIADPDATLRAELAKELGIEQSYDSANELFLATQLDAVVIASPSAYHERQIAAAFDAGLHVLCEAPPAIVGREMSHIVTSAGLVGKTFMWSAPHRFQARQQTARQLVESGKLNEVYQGHTLLHVSSKRLSSNSWQLDQERGGGALLEVGYRAIDKVWFAMGCPDPIEAMASRFDLRSQEQADKIAIEKIGEDALVGQVRFKNGACLQLSVHASPIHPNQEQENAQIFGKSGRLDLLQGHFHDLDAPSPQQYASLEDPHLLEAQAREFVAAIREERDPLNSSKQAQALMKMIDALATSAKEKRAESIKVERSLDDLFGAL